MGIRTSLLAAGVFLGGATFMCAALPAFADTAAPMVPVEIPAAPAGADLTKLAVAFLDACVTRDADYVAANSIEDPVGSFSSFGSGAPKISDRIEFAEHLRPLKKVGWDGLDPKGWVSGNVAWFADVADGILPDGKKIPIRISLVMRNTGAGWKVVHVHVSEGVHRDGIRKGS